MIEKDPKQTGQTGYNIQFEFMDLKKLLKVTVPPRSTIKAQRPFFAMKMDYDFAHMDIRVDGKFQDNKTLIPIPQAEPLEDIPFFNKKKDIYVIQIRIKYGG